MNRLPLSILGAFALGCFATTCSASEFARSANFVVLAEDAQLAHDVLTQAERYRREIAESWLGESLPEGVGAAMINVRISADEEQGLTWPTRPDAARRYHRVWVTTASRQDAVGPVLKHELTHVLLATWMPDQLPPWADEGAASLYDDAERAAMRRKTVAWFARSGNWPRLAHVLTEQTITADELAAYTIAASLTEFLLSRADRPTFLRFAAEGRRKGWDHALQSHYKISDVDALQRAWRQWASSSIAAE
ncbi:MAG: hypothetical protein RIC55_29645 [Pirellulaceae bacterium]